MKGFIDKGRAARAWVSILALPVAYPLSELLVDEDAGVRFMVAVAVVTFLITIVFIWIDGRLRGRNREPARGNGDSRY